MQQIINFLLACGFVPAGETKGVLISSSGTTSWGEAVNVNPGSELLTSSSRKRFAFGNIRCTVGKRTVSFYRITGGKAHGFQNFKTTDFEGIQKFMERGNSNA